MTLPLWTSRVSRSRPSAGRFFLWERKPARPQVNGIGPKLARRGCGWFGGRRGIRRARRRSASAPRWLLHRELKRGTLSGILSDADALLSQRPHDPPGRATSKGAWERLAGRGTRGTGGRPRRVRSGGSGRLRPAPTTRPQSELGGADEFREERFSLRSSSAIRLTDGQSACRAARSYTHEHMPTERIAVLFDIDGTLIVTGGAGAASWRMAFDELYGIPADIGAFTDAGMTDPEVGRKTFSAVLHRDPERKEFTRLLERRLHYLRETVGESGDYRVLPGVHELLPRLIDEGCLLGLVTGNVEAAAHVKLHRARLNRFFSFGGYGSDAAERGEITRIALRRAGLVYGERLSPAQAIAVGDTPHDVQGAHAAGMACVGVGSHNFTVEQLREAGADYAIGSLEDGLPI